MKKSKAKKLEFCCIDFSIDEARAFDTLLTRILGDESFAVKKVKKQKRFEFIFWATPKEQELIEKLWDNVLDLKWNEDEFKELVES